MLFATYTITDYRREYPIADSFPSNLAQAVRLRLFYRVRLSEKQSAKELKARIDAIKSPDVDTVVQTYDAISLSTPPNDYYNCFQCGDNPRAQHHLDLINALGAWDITTGLSCIKIGITDENFQHHDDLDTKVIITPRTAYISPADTNKSHGVEVAGMAGAATNNNLGISSLGYNISLLYYDKGYNGYNAVLNAIYDGCKVVNCSWLIPGTCSSSQNPPHDPDEDWKDALSLAKQYNVTIVAAAGNGYQNPDQGCLDPTLYIYPASYEGVISVTSVGSQWDEGDPTHPANWKNYHRQFIDQTDARYNLTAHNNRVDISAPGYWVETTARNNNYGNTGGTSLAAPLVSAAAALLYSINPFFTPSEIEAYLKNNAVDIYGIGDNNLWVGKLGEGRLDAGASLQAALSNAITFDFCNSCPSGSTYFTGTSSPISKYHYDKYIYAGDNNGSVYTSNTSSTTFIATDYIDLTPGFNAVATANSYFSARIEPCTIPGGRVGNNNKDKNTGSLDILNEKEQVKIYPNPANDIIMVAYNSLDKKPITIELINSIGVVVKKVHKSIGIKGLYKTEIGVRNLSSGLYYVKIKSGTKIYTNNFIKIR